MSVLTVEFAGELRRVTRNLTFGRAADFCIDDNQYMHRCVGEFLLADGFWWLRNRGSRIPLTLVSHDGKWVQLPPDAVQALSGGGGFVRFRAGQANYELTYRGTWAEPEPAELSSTGDDVNTLRFKIDLTPREVDFLSSFCAPHFAPGGSGALPTYAEVAAAWGVSVKTLDNTLQNLRRKIRDAGFAGAADSSDALVAFVLGHGLIGQTDLDWAGLTEPDGPRPASRSPRFRSTKF